MLRFIKLFACVSLLGAGLPAAYAFSLGGPQSADAFQVEDLGYFVGNRADLVGPKNLGEEYRRNTPILYYACDANFLDFFGSNGVAAVDAAFAIFNALTNVSAYSPDLSEFSTETRRINHRAAALNLLDVKSEMMTLLMEQMSLADPIRYNWCLHDRWIAPGGACPLDVYYLVIMRNLGIVPSALDQLQYTPYINGVYYSYYIFDYCDTPRGGNPQSETIPFPVDGTLAQFNNYLPVASLFYGGTTVGQFFTRLTRDDVAGLRYLLRAGNVNWEDIPAGGTAFSTNKNLALLVTSNLTDLVSASMTNDDATLLTIYPDLNITSSSYTWQPVVTGTQVAYFTNFPWSPAGSAPTLVLATVYDTNFMPVYQRTFGNVVTNFLDLTNGFVFPNNDVFTNGVPQTNATVTVITESVGVSQNPWAPAGVLQTNTVTSTTSFTTNMLVGDFFIVPATSCGYRLLSNVLTKVIIVTNSVTATNGTAGTTNFTSFAQTILTYFTNHYFVYYPVDCLTTQPGLRRGVEKITFLRRDFDSLLGTFWYPQTTNFNTTIVTNSRDFNQVVQRTATQPDFLITASDLVTGPNAQPIVFQDARSLTFTPAPAPGYPGLAGPGTVTPPTTITFNKSGPVFENFTDAQGRRFLDESTQFAFPNWGSFDDSTNTPAIYPNGTSIVSMENMIVLQCTTTTDSNFKVGQFRMVQLAGAGGTPYVTPPYQPSGPGPYFVWTLAPGSPGLPPGLNLAYDGSGLIYGTPTLAGVYDFVIRMMDSTARYADWEISLTVNP